MVPNEQLADYAEHGTPGAQAMAKELLALRSFAASAQAQADGLHDVVRRTMKDHGGPASACDLYACVGGLVLEAERLRALLDDMSVRLAEAETGRDMAHRTITRMLDLDSSGGAS